MQVVLISQVNHVAWFMAPQWKHRRARFLHHLEETKKAGTSDSSTISTAESEKKDDNIGAQYLYFFLDTTLPGFQPSINILGFLFL